LFFLLFAYFAAGTVAVADNRKSSATSTGSSLSFSIADFDGDSRPDLASVEACASDSSGTNYSIRLELSAAEQQTFRVMAPVGGLEIVSRDVNGDRALDVVVTTRWLRQPVAILLNDGHGGFRRVDPAAFPAAFGESGNRWSAPAEEATDAVGVSPPSREDLGSEGKFLLDLPERFGFLASSDLRFAIAQFLISHLGRAPPSGFPQA